jgi:hypothetical protein
MPRPRTGVCEGERVRDALGADAGGREGRRRGEYLGRTGDGDKLFKFGIVARDAGGEIGRCRHVRAIVDTAKMEARAVNRMGRKETL